MSIGGFVSGWPSRRWRFLLTGNASPQVWGKIPPACTARKRGGRAPRLSRGSCNVGRPTTCPEEPSWKRGSRTIAPAPSFPRIAPPHTEISLSFGNIALVRQSLQDVGGVGTSRGTAAESRASGESPTVCGRDGYLTETKPIEHGQWGILLQLARGISSSGVSLRSAQSANDAPRDHRGAFPRHRMGTSAKVAFVTSISHFERKTANATMFT